MKSDYKKEKKTQRLPQVISRDSAELLELTGRVARILFSGKIANSNDLTIIDVEIDVGACTTPAHMHKTLEEVMYVLKGSAKLWGDGEVYAINAGEAILVPEGCKHMVKNVGDTPLLMLTFYGDKDFRKGFIEFPEINNTNF